MERNKKIYLTSDGTEETGKKIIAYLEWLGGKNTFNADFKTVLNNKDYPYWYIDRDQSINAKKNNFINELSEERYKPLDINTIIFDNDYNIIGNIVKINIEDTDDSDNTEECLKIIVNNIINKQR